MGGGMENNTQLFRLEGGLLNCFPEPVVLVDHLGNVLASNEASESEIGITYPGKALAMSFRHPSAIEAVESVLRSGKPQNVEVTFLAPAARTFNLIVAPLSESAFHGLEGRGAVLVFHDVTAERRAEQMRADFVANASHELRSPLSSMTGFIETLQGPAKEDPVAREKFLSIMSAECGRMARLIEDLLSLSAIESNEHVAPSDEIDIRTLLFGAKDALSPTATAADINVIIDIPEVFPLIIGDIDQLSQVFRNLMENAIAYGGKGSEVKIVATIEDRMPDSDRPGVSIAVIDAGEGIPRKHLTRLTERFYRVDKARSRTAGGTGLGLAIVKHIVSRHRGRLSVDSKVGQGSRFTVLLPSA